MLSVSPFFTDAFIPNLSAYDVPDFRHASRVQRVPHREPNYSLTENDQAAHLEVELPGVAKENVKLDLTGNRIALTAKRFSQSAVPNEEFFRKLNEDNPEHERNENDAEGKAAETGTPKPSLVYELRLRIGNRYDVESIEASMEGDGLLKLKIPTKKADVPRHIEIQ